MVVDTIPFSINEPIVINSDLTFDKEKSDKPLQTVWYLKKRESNPLAKNCLLPESH
jgi:hypothetical protein